LLLWVVVAVVNKILALKVEVVVVVVV